MDAYERHEQLIPKMKERFLNKPKILVSEVKNYLKLTDNQTMSLLRCMKNKGLIKKLRHGIYKFNRK